MPHVLSIVDSRTGVRLLLSLRIVNTAIVVVSLGGEYNGKFVSI